MGEDFKGDIMSKLMNKDEKSEKEFGDFLKNVDKIQALVKGMTSNDEKVVKDSMEKADEMLKKTGKGDETAKKNTNSADDSDENEKICDDGKIKKKKKTFNRTVINDKAFRDEKKEDGPVNQDEFMKVVEDDARKRAVDRKQRREESGGWKEKGEELFKEGRFQEALEAFDKALSIFKDWPALWTGRAQVHLRLDNPRAALDDCEWAFRSDEKSLNAHVTMSRIRRHQHQYAEALEVLQKALEFHPGKKNLIYKYMDEVKLEQMKEVSSHEN